MHFGPRQAQTFGKQGHRGLRHMAERRLHRVQHRQQRTLHLFMGRDDIADPRGKDGTL